VRRLLKDQRFACVQIPSNVSTEEAASIPLALVTAAIGLYNGGNAGIGLTAPWTPEGKGKYAGKPFVISAASTSVGQLGKRVPAPLPLASAEGTVPALQLAKLSGFSPIITTSSPSNFGLLKSLGATHTLGRSAIGSLGAEVAKITLEPVMYAYDAWSNAETQQALYDLLAPNGGLVIVLPKAVKEVDDKNITVLNVYGSVHVPVNRDIGVSLFGALEGLLANGTIKVKSVGQSCYEER
jgi:NADPH:quinone reductase-like Zn-dependent oxidoreductase